MAKTLFLNGTLVDPSQGLHNRLDLLVDGEGRIAEVAPDLSRRDAARRVDAKGLVIAPGFIDLHTHLREPGGEGQETIATGTRSAAAGGFTTVFCMPNTKPVCDSETGVHYIMSRAKSDGVINVVPIAAITKGQQGEELTNFARLKAVGAGAFSDDGHPVMNAEMMRRALEYSRMLGVPIMEHCEDMNLTGDGVMHEGAVSIRLGLKGIPRVSESIMVARNCALAAATGGHIHICHVSARESVEAIREAKRHGVRVTAEVSPHHLTMTDTWVLGYNTAAKMKPPVCAEEDRESLIRALEDGTLDCIATDHAPHTTQAKENVFDAAPFGIIGFETAFPVLYTEFVTKGRWTVDFLIEKLTKAPAKVMGAGWGTLAVGAPADLALLRLNAPWTFTKKHVFSRCTNSPWLGQEFTARVVGTYVAGREVFAAMEEEVVSAGKATKAEKKGKKAKDKDKKKKKK